jgi:hypothetical protein
MKEKQKEESACPLKVEEEVKSILMLCFYIVSSKYSIFLKNLDSS